MTVLERLNDIGFERSRRALASVSLGLFLSFYLVVALLLALNGMDAYVPVFVALAVCYGVGSFSVAAEWFWGRWFALGLGWSGLMMIVATVVLGTETNAVMLANGALHGLVILALSGKKMVARYDEQPAWRERYAMDEFGVARLRKTVTRASASLPSVIFWALAPKDPGQGASVAALAAVTLAAGGLYGVVRLRTWGVFGLAAAAAVILATGDLLTPTLGISVSAHGALGLGPTLAAAFLAVAVVPFAGPTLRYLRGR
jgi:hypothetical protein